MAEQTLGAVVRELHKDLGRKYRIHQTKLTEAWHSMSKSQRVTAMKAGAYQGVVLKHPSDPALGNVYKFIPEWNLQDITAPDSDAFLDILRHRATTTLESQYCEGRPGGQGDYQYGDHQLIVKMMHTRNLRHVDPFKDCYTLFMGDGEQYGYSFKLVKEKEESLAELRPIMQSGMCPPQATGELILQRQEYLLQCLNIMIEDVLEIASSSRLTQKRPKKPEDAATAALEKLAITGSQPKVDLPYVSKLCEEQKGTQELVLSLLCNEPVALAHAVNIWFFSRPELLPDEKGRSLPAHTDKHISAAVLDVIYHHIKESTIWRYICRLVQMLETTTAAQKYQRSMILQELANVCQLEYTRAQDMLRRQVSTASGSKHFKRASNALGKHPRITMKGNPETLTVTNPQLHYMLRLCQPETTALKAIDWIKKLDDLHRAVPADRDNLTEREVDALSDIAVIIGCIQSLTAATSMPSFSRKKGQLFLPRVAALDEEVASLKLNLDLDLGDFAIPIDNLLEPGMAEGALQTLDDFIVKHMGAKLGLMYQDLSDDCILKVEAVKGPKNTATQQEFIPLPSEKEDTSGLQVQKRREKEKTRPTAPSVYDITASAEPPVADNAVEAKKDSATLKCKPSTVDIFKSIFARSSESRGSISWFEFLGAMTDIGFSVIPNYGSVVTFMPPTGDMRPFTYHRPHGSRMEGWRLLFLSRRLSRVYGWKEDTFQVA